MPYELKPGVWWWALRTRSNFERIVEQQLASRSMEAFLPTYRAYSRRKDRSKIITLPLFAGYVFVHTDLSVLSHRVGVLRTRGVARIVGGASGPEPVRDREIESIKILCAADRMLEPWGRIEVGKPVRIVSGGLAGVTGVVLDVVGRGRRIICNVELLGRAVAAELKADQVAPLTTLDI